MNSILSPAIISFACLEILGACSNTANNTVGSVGPDGGGLDAGTLEGGSSILPFDSGIPRDGTASNPDASRPATCAKVIPPTGMEEVPLTAPVLGIDALWKRTKATAPIEKLIWRTRTRVGLNVKVDLTTFVTPGYDLESKQPLRRLQIVNGDVMGLEPTGDAPQLLANLAEIGEIPPMLVVWVKVEDLAAVEGGSATLYDFLTETYPSSATEVVDPVWILGLEAGVKLLTNVQYGWGGDRTALGTRGSKTNIIGYNVDFWCSFPRFEESTYPIGPSISNGEKGWVGMRLAFAVGDDVTFDLSTDCGRRLQTPHDRIDGLLTSLMAGGPVRYVKAAKNFDTKAIVHQTLPDQLRFVLQPDVCGAAGPPP